MSEEQIAQWFSIVASVFIVFGYFSISDVRAKLILIVGCVLFAIHFYMLGAMTAMIINVVNIFRISLSIKFHKSQEIFILFIVLYLFVAVVTYDSWIDLLPVMASVTGCIAMFLFSGISFRLISVIGTVCWLVHNIYVFSIGGITTELFVLMAHMATIYRLIRREKLNDQTA